MKKLSLLLTLMIFISCGKDSPLIPGSDTVTYKYEPAEGEEYSYELRGTACTTGVHTYTTFEEVCSALTDEELNNSCAEDKRIELFTNEECPGSFI